MGNLFGGGSDGTAAALAEQNKETMRMRQETAAEKADILTQEQASRKARQRGGSRALLSSARMDAEEGLTDTLGSVKGI